MNSGSWSAVLPWPLIGLHVALLPDGRVFSFGSDQNGDQGLHKIYDIWDPKTGVHLTSTDAIATDEFCSAEILDPITGNMIIMGGDGRPQGNINKGVVDVNTFDYHAGSLTTSATGHLNFPRWYGSLISLGGGQLLAIGGENSGFDDNDLAAVPVRARRSSILRALGWKALPGAYSADIATNWFYPRVWSRATARFSASPPGEGDNAGTLFKINTTGQGSVTNLGHTPFESQDYDPAAMFAPDKILTIDKNGNGLDHGYQRGDADLYADRRRRLKSRLVEPYRSRRRHGPVNRRQQGSALTRAILRPRRTTPRSGTPPPANGPTTPAPQSAASTTQIPCSCPMVPFSRPAAARLAL